MINRFQPYKGRTSFAVIYGNTYRGAISKFAAPVYGYVKVGNKKGDPKWKLGLWIGKTEAQDAYIIAEGHQVMLTKSIRRVEQAWQKHLAYYDYVGFEAHSWELQANFGGRIVPTKRQALPLGVSQKATEEQLQMLEEAHDPEAEAVKADAMSYLGKLEEQREFEDAKRESELALKGGAPIPISQKRPCQWKEILWRHLQNQLNPRDLCENNQQRTTSKSTSASS